MPEQQCHGGIIIDDIKLSENLALDHYGNVDGLVHLGQFSSCTTSTSLADDTLLVFFHPLTGKWHQVFSAFASRGNVKAYVLIKIIVEAVIMAENSFLRYNRRRHLEHIYVAQFRNFWENATVHLHDCSLVDL